MAIKLRFDAEWEIAFDLTVRDDGDGVMSNGSWSYAFGNIRESNAVELAAAAIRDSCVIEVMCS